MNARVNACRAVNHRDSMGCDISGRDRPRTRDRDTCRWTHIITTSSRVHRRGGQKKETKARLTEAATQSICPFHSSDTMNIPLQVIAYCTMTCRCFFRITQNRSENGRRGHAGGRLNKPESWSRRCTRSTSDHDTSHTSRVPTASVAVRFFSDVGGPRDPVPCPVADTPARRQRASVHFFESVVHNRPEQKRRHTAPAVTVGLDPTSLVRHQPKRRARPRPQPPPRPRPRRPEPRESRDDSRAASPPPRFVMFFKLKTFWRDLSAEPILLLFAVNAQLCLTLQLEFLFSFRVDIDADPKVSIRGGPQTNRLIVSVADVGAVRFRYLRPLHGAAAATLLWTHSRPLSLRA